MRMCLLIWLLMIVFNTNTWADNNQSKEILLQRLASSNQDTSRLSTLFQLIEITYQMPLEQIGYINQLLKEAKEQKNNFYICQAYLRQIIYAYNKYDNDEVNKWMKLLEPIARKEKLYDILFRGKQCVIDMLLINEQYELNEKEANLMLKEAKELGNITGQISAYQSLAYVYSRTYRNKEAFNILEKAFQLCPESNNSFQVGEIVRTITSLCENIKDYPNWLKYQKVQDSLINCLEKQYPNEFFHDDRMLNAISYLRYYIQRKEWDKANEYLQQMDLYYSDEYNMVYKYNYFTAKNYYFMAVENWEEVLKSVNLILELIKSTSEVDYSQRLAQKAWVLNKMGYHQESLSLHKQAKQLKDSLRISTINKQTEQLKNSYKSDLQVLSHAEQQQKIQQIFLILSGIIILILITSIIHSNRIKQKLLKAEKIMQAMMNETEQANKVKERFLSNLNMTIRPPLDIIVNNSTRLTSDEQFSQTEKNQLSTLINDTSAYLMDLINNILILSKLEAGMMKFNVKEFDIIQLVGNMAEAGNHRKPGTIFIDTPDQTVFNINGDSDYLKQVISSICNPSDTGDKVIHVHFEKNEETTLNIIFTNTTLASEQPSQELVIRNEINRMTMESFGGKYHITTSLSDPCIILSFNQNIKKLNM